MTDLLELLDIAGATPTVHYSAHRLPRAMFDKFPGEPLDLSLDWPCYSKSGMVAGLKWEVFCNELAAEAAEVAPTDDAERAALTTTQEGNPPA